MTRVVKQPEERLEEILEGAMEVFYEKGYDGASIADIAKRLGISQGLCYRYVSSKADLLERAVERYAKRQIQPLLPVLTDGKRTLREKLLACPSFPEMEAAKDPTYQVFHQEKNRWIHQLLELKVCQLLFPVVEQQLKIAAERGEVRLTDCRAMASLCLYGQLGILEDPAMGPEEKRERLMNAISSALGLHPQAAEAVEAG